MDGAVAAATGGAAVIDRRQFFRRFCGAAVSVALAPVDAFRLPELDPFRGTATWAVAHQAGPPLVMTDLTDMIHRIYTQEIVSHLQNITPMLKVFEGQSAYRMDGERLVFGIDLKYPVQ